MRQLSSFWVEAAGSVCSDLLSVCFSSRTHESDGRRMERSRVTELIFKLLYIFYRSFLNDVCASKCIKSQVDFEVNNLPKQKLPL